MQKNTKLILLILVLILIGIGAYFYIQKQNPTPNNSNNSASTPTPTVSESAICWNRVISDEGKLYWPNGCKGNPDAEMCTQALVELSGSEKADYDAWVKAGSEPNPKCKM